jgi:hypothetical protein
MTSNTTDFENKWSAEFADLVIQLKNDRKVEDCGVAFMQRAQKKIVEYGASLSPELHSFPLYRISSDKYHILVQLKKEYYVKLTTPE